MNFRILRAVLFTCLSLSVVPIATPASATPSDIQQKLMDSAARDPMHARHVLKMLSRIERGQLDQVVQSTVQQFFRIAPRGELSEAMIEVSNKRRVASARARFLAQYLSYDLDGDGTISKSEMAGLYGNSASKILALVGTSDRNNDGDISAQELRLAADKQTNRRQNHQQVAYLMAFDLDDNGIVVAEELLKGLRMLAASDPASSASQNETQTTSGGFTTAEEDPETAIQNPTNADGLPVELHMVGIYEPRKKRTTDGLSQTEQVLVKVDRPGVSVALVLGSFRPTRWVIETGPNTKVDTVISSDRNRLRGEVILNGQAVSATYRDLPLAYKSKGNRFQPFHEMAAKVARVRNAASFQGSYKAPEGGFVIDAAPGVPTKAEVEAALNANALPAAELTPVLRSAFEGKTEAPGAKWKLRNEGFSGTDENGTAILHKLPLAAPVVSHPMGSAYDPAGQQIWGVTLGGEGFLYRYDIAKNSWSARSMDNIDAGGLIFDQKNEHLIATPGPHGRSGYLVMDTSGKLQSKLSIAPTEYPGLTNTYDPGNGPSPRMVPIMIDGDLLLVRAESRIGSPRTSKSRWVYLVDLQSGKVRLVR